MQTRSVPRSCLENVHSGFSIDFTVLDSGLIGHTIPVELICNMAHGAKPGAGLKFIETESGNRNKYSRLLSVAKHAKEDVETPSGTVLVVARFDSNGDKVERRSHSHSRSKKSKKEIDIPTTPPISDNTTTDAATAN